MAKNEVITSDKFKVDGRLSFLRLDKPKAFQEGQDPRYEATVLIDPSSEAGKKALSNLLTLMAGIAKQKWGKIPKKLKELGAAIGVKGVVFDPKEKDDGIVIKCLYDGDTKEYDGYKGMWVLATHNKTKPAVANRKGESVLPGEDEFPFSGSYGRLSGTFWTQDNQFGKQINVNLRGVQFMKKGDAFGAGAINPEDEFDAVEDVESTGDEDSPFGKDE